MTPLLALASAAPAGDSSTLAIGVLVVGLTALLNLALTAKQLLGGNKGERQIEPTQIASLDANIKSLSAAVGTLNREVGTLSTLSHQVDGLHTRVGGISRELAHTVARVDGLERREPKRRGTE